MSYMVGGQEASHEEFQAEVKKLNRYVSGKPEVKIPSVAAQRTLKYKAELEALLDKKLSALDIICHFKISRDQLEARIKRFGLKGKSGYLVEKKF